MRLLRRIKAFLFPPRVDHVVMGGRHVRPGRGLYALDSCLVRIDGDLPLWTTGRDRDIAGFTRADAERTAARIRSIGFEAVAVPMRYALR